MTTDKNSPLCTWSSKMLIDLFVCTAVLLACYFFIPFIIFFHYRNLQIIKQRHVGLVFIGTVNSWMTCGWMLANFSIFFTIDTSPCFVGIFITGLNSSLKSKWFKWYIEKQFSHHSFWPFILSTKTASTKLDFWNQSMKILRLRKNYDGLRSSLSDFSTSLETMKSLPLPEICRKGTIWQECKSSHQNPIQRIHSSARYQKSHYWKVYCHGWPLNSFLFQSHSFSIKASWSYQDALHF